MLRLRDLRKSIQTLGSNPLVGSLQKWIIAKRHQIQLEAGFERLQMLQRSLQCVCPGVQVPITSILRSQPRRHWKLSKGAGQLREIGPGNQSRWACEEMQNLVSFGLCCQQKSGLKHSVNISNRLCWDQQLAGIPTLCVAADAVMMV